MKNLSKALTSETLKIYWRFTKPEWRMVSLALGSLLTVSVVFAYVPYLYRDLVNLMAGVGPGAGKEAIKILAAIGVFSLGTIVLRRLQDWAGVQFELKVKKRILEYCYKYLQNHSVTFFNNTFAGSLVRKVNRFDRAYEEIADQCVYGLGMAIVRMAIIIVGASFVSWIFSAIILGWICLFAVASYALAKRRLKYDLARAEQDSIVTGFLADTMTNTLNVKLFTGEAAERRTFSALASEQMHRLRASWNAGLQSDLVQGALLTILEVVTMYMVFVLWQEGRVSIGDFALLQAYLAQIGGRLWDLGRNIRRIFEAVADANEMTEILLTPHEVVDAPEAKALVVSKGVIDFKNVGFSYYANSDVFKEFNFIVDSNERVALVGPSGGGKSTIVKMLLRFFDITSGKILIDGQDISKVTQESLHDAVSLVPQEPILFHRSLMENIRYGRLDATDQEVIAAAKLAHCHEFISGFPEGYNTTVGERGVKLSGGERQRVAIARAIVKNAPILILDEATSSLDSESESLVQDAMKTLMKGKTVIVIAHRLSTIMQMDRIVVLEKGAIIEQGKHEELIKAKQGTYQKLWEIQAGGFT